jgi:hypothetical protein
LVSTTKSFLDATLQKQVAKLLSLQESVKQQCDNAKSIADSLVKLSSAQVMGNLTDIAWPTLTSVNPTSPQPIHLESLLHSHAVSQANPKVLHHIALVSKQLLIEYSPLEVNETPQERTIDAQQELCQTFNNWVGNCTITPEGGNPPPPLWTVCSIAIFDHPAIPLEFDTDASKDSFVNLCTKNPFLLSEISPRAQIRPCTFLVIFWFIPCQGQFDPSSKVTSTSLREKTT